MERDGREPPSKRARQEGGIADDIMSRLDSFTSRGSRQRTTPMTALDPGQRVINVVPQAQRNVWHEREPQEHGYLVNQRGDIVDEKGETVREPIMPRNAEYMDVVFSREEALRNNPDYRTYAMVAGKFNRTLDEYLLPNNNPQIGRVTDQINRTLDNERRRRNLSLKDQSTIIDGLRDHYERLEKQLDGMTNIAGSFEPTAMRWSWLGTITGYAMIGNVVPTNYRAWLGSPEPLPYWLLSSKVRLAYRDLLRDSFLQNEKQAKAFFVDYFKDDALFWNMGEHHVPVVNSNVPHISWIRGFYDALATYNTQLSTSAELQAVHGLYLLIRDIYGTLSLPLRPDPVLSRLPAVKHGVVITTHVQRIYLALNRNIASRDTESSTRGDVNEPTKFPHPITTEEELGKESPLWKDTHEEFLPLTARNVADSHWGQLLKKNSVNTSDLVHFQTLLEWTVDIFTKDPVPIPIPIQSLVAWVDHVFKKSNNTQPLHLGHDNFLRDALLLDNATNTYRMSSRRDRLRMEISNLDMVHISAFKQWLLFGGIDPDINKYRIGTIDIHQNQEDSIEISLKIRYPLVTSDAIATVHLFFPGSKPMVTRIQTLFPANHAASTVRFLWLSNLVNYMTWTTIFERSPESIITFYNTTLKKKEFSEAIVTTLGKVESVLNEFDFTNNAISAALSKTQFYGMIEFVREMIRSTMKITPPMTAGVLVEGPDNLFTVQATDPRPLQVPIIEPSLEAFYIKHKFLANLSFNPPTKFDAGFTHRQGVLLRQLEESETLLEKTLSLVDIDAFQNVDRLRFNHKLLNLDLKVKTSPSFDVYYKQQLMVAARSLEEPGSVMNMFTDITDPRPYYLLNLIVAMGIFSGHVHPYIKQQSTNNLVSQRQSILSAEEKYARLVNDDMSVAVGNIQDLVTKLYTPQQAYQFMAIISGRITIPEIFAAAGNDTLVAIHEDVPSLKHVPYDVLVGNTEATAEDRKAYIKEEASDPEAVRGLWVAFYTHIATNGTLIQRMHPKNYMTAYQQKLAQIEYIKQCGVFHRYRAEPMEQPSSNPKILQPWRVTYNTHVH
jgi:hypothetical protein